jgi:hypothetical protein
VGITEGPGAIQKDKVYISFQPKMLKSIIEHNDIRLKFANRQQAGFKSIFTDNNRYVFQATGNQKRFISSLLRIHQYVPAITDNPTVFFSTALVTPADNHYPDSGLL